MATTVAETASTEGTYKLELATAYGPVYRDVLKAPPRDCDPSEVPIIDVSGLFGDLPSRQALAAAIREAAENTGFFYIKNHGIPGDVIDAALSQAKAFFAQPDERKREVATSRSRFFNGWTERHGSQISPTEGRDFREGFMWRYDPRYDPEPKDDADVPEDVRPWLRGEELVWDGTAHLPGFKAALLAYWRACLTLARRLIRAFALALDLPEAHFDRLVTYPGADGVLNYYPAREGGAGQAGAGAGAGAVAGAADAAQDDVDVDVGLGAHTDLQSFTLLWQDAVGGLQVLGRDGRWARVPPVEGTLVVNIGDFLMRLSNDRLRSTVHRVFNRAPVDRYSMPFFFGFNFNERCGVLPSCAGEGNPPRYEPITCGEWCQLRFEQGGLKQARRAFSSVEVPGQQDASPKEP